MMAVSLPSLLPAPTLVFPGPLGHWPLGSRLPHSSLTLPSNWMFVSFEDYIIKVTLLTLFKLLVLLGGVIGHECPMAGWWVNLSELTAQVKTGAGETSARTTCCADRILVPWPRWDGFIIFCFATSTPQGKCWLRCVSLVNMLWAPWHRF